MSEMIGGKHSYQSSSWRGSWPVFRCAYCGCASSSGAANQPCPGNPPIPTPTPTPARSEAAGEEEPIDYEVEYHTLRYRMQGFEERNEKGLATLKRLVEERASLRQQIAAAREEGVGAEDAERAVDALVGVTIAMRAPAHYMGDEATKEANVERFKAAKAKVMRLILRTPTQPQRGEGEEDPIC